MDERIVDHKHRKGKREPLPLSPLQGGLEIGIVEELILYLPHHGIFLPRRAKKRLEGLVIRKRHASHIIQIPRKRPAQFPLRRNIKPDKLPKVPVLRHLRPPVGYLPHPVRPVRVNNQSPIIPLRRSRLETVNNTQDEGFLRRGERKRHEGLRGEGRDSITYSFIFARMFFLRSASAMFFSKAVLCCSSSLLAFSLICCTKSRLAEFT